MATELRRRNYVLEYEDGNKIYYTPDNIYSDIKFFHKNQLQSIRSLRSTIEAIYRDETLSPEEQDRFVQPYKEQAFQIAEQLADAYDQLMPTGDTWFTTITNTIGITVTGLWKCIAVLLNLITSPYVFFKMLQSVYEDINIQKEQGMSGEGALAYMLVTLGFAGISVFFIASAIKSITDGVHDLLSSIFFTSERELLIREELDKRLRDGYLFFVEEIYRFASGSGKCFICMKPYTNSHFKAFLPCGHSFGQSCIQGHLLDRGTCPICGVRFQLKDLSGGKGVLANKRNLTESLLKLKYNGNF